MIVLVLGILFIIGFSTTVLRHGPVSPATAGSQSTVAAPQPRPSSSAPDSPEHLLAIIEAHGFVAQDDITVARFRSLLAQLSSSFGETPKQVGDMTVKAQQLLREKGIEQDLLALMEGMNQILDSKPQHPHYSEVLSLYIALRTKGQTHDNAIAGVRDFIHALPPPPG